MKKLKHIVAIPCAFAMLAVLSSGCTSTSKNLNENTNPLAKYIDEHTAPPSAAMKSLPPRATREQQQASREAIARTPKSIVATWTDTVLRIPGQTPTRGLGGRLYFYNARGQAVPASGQLTVYGYDDSIDGTQKTSPDRKYVFTPAEFATHYSKSDIGPSYSVWIPWDEIGSTQRMVSVLPSFSTGDGQLVMGDIARHTLPGPKAPLAASHGSTRSQLKSEIPNAQVQGANGAQGMANAQRGGVSLASFSEPVAKSNETADAQQSMRSTSIPLPQIVQKRLKSSHNNATQPSASATEEGSNNAVSAQRPLASMSQSEIANMARELMQKARNERSATMAQTAVDRAPALPGQSKAGSADPTVDPYSRSQSGSQVQPLPRVPNRLPPGSTLPQSHYPGFAPPRTTQRGNPAPSPHFVSGTRQVPGAPVFPQAGGPIQ